jgi:hypothetical protein
VPYFSELFCGEFSPFSVKYFEKKIFCHKFPFLNRLYIYIYAKYSHNCLQHERFLKIILLSYFEYCQIWLNTFTDDCQLSNITKLGGKKPTGYSRTGCLNMAISNVFPNNVTTFGPFFPRHKAFVCVPLTFLKNLLLLLLLLFCWDVKIHQKHNIAQKFFFVFW